MIIYVSGFQDNRDLTCRVEEPPDIKTVPQVPKGATILVDPFNETVGDWMLNKRFRMVDYWWSETSKVWLCNSFKEIS